MIQTAPGESVTLQDCQALMVCLDGGRFAIVPVDSGLAGASSAILTCDDKPDLRNLVAGDHVVYRGDECRVRAIAVYR
jgi:hypothetical protein